MLFKALLGVVITGLRVVVGLVVVVVRLVVVVLLVVVVGLVGLLVVVGLVGLLVAGLLVVVVVVTDCWERKSLETKLMAPSLPNERKKWTYME